MEVFVFLQMGGSREHITILQIDADHVNEQNEASMFANVDISTSECSVESDRQKLLGTVEQGTNIFFTTTKHVITKKC